ncbi:tetratricopeptide repeat protein [Desulfothermus sp.]
MNKNKRLNIGHPHRIYGVFSIIKRGKIGAGHTQKKSSHNLLFFAEEQEDGNISLQPINKNFVPSGPKSFISKEEFLQNFIPEPDIYMNKVYPAIRELQKTIARGERYRRNKKYYSAEYEFKNALRIDEENIRATFGLGLTYLDRGDKEKAKLVFKRIYNLNAAFEREHKHLFNEFGIKMRKNKMYKEALKYYLKAYRLEKWDEHLFFNIARVLFELDKYKQALKFVNKGLVINPNFNEGIKLKKVIEKRLQSQNPTCGMVK